MRAPSTLASRKMKNPLAYVFIAPNVLIYLVFIFIPLVSSLVLSLTNYNLFTLKWVGLENYTVMLRDSHFVKSIGNTFQYAFFSIFPSMSIGLLSAVILNGNIPGKSLFRTFIYLPNIISLVASSLAWVFILNSSPDGIANRLLAVFGQSSVEWLADINLAMPSVIVMSIWGQIGFNMIVYLAGLQSIPASLYEAATIDGAGRIKQFFGITFPLLKPTTFFLFVMACISSFQVFGQVYIMTGGGPLNSTTTIVHQIYQNAFQGYKMGYASAQAVLLLLIIFSLTLVNFKYGNTKETNDVA